MKAFLIAKGIPDLAQEQEMASAPICLNHFGTFLPGCPSLAFVCVSAGRRYVVFTHVNIDPGAVRNAWRFLRGWLNCRKCRISCGVIGEILSIPTVPTPYGELSLRAREEAR